MSAEISVLSRSEWPCDASLDDAAVQALHEVRHPDPFSILGLHRLCSDSDRSDNLCVVRVWHPELEDSSQTDAGDVLLRLVFADDPDTPRLVPMYRRCAWLYEAVFAAPQMEEALLRSESLDGMSVDVSYTVQVQARDVELHDAYSYRDVLILDAELDQLQAGVFPAAADVMGSHRVELNGIHGLRFVVWAPNARSVSVVGDWNNWDGRSSPMRKRCRYPGGGFTGVWELFIPFGRERKQVPLGCNYGYEVGTPHGTKVKRIDPFAQEFEVPPHDIHSAPSLNSSKVALCDDKFRDDPFAWTDADWLRQRDSLRRSNSLLKQPMAIYEVHLPSWRRTETGGFLNYREIAPLLVQHMQSLNFNYVELMGMAHHPYVGSWGYQVSGYYGCYPLLGSPDDFKFLVDTLHNAGIGVLLDFVPAHFCKDACSFADYDGTATFEYEDPREGEQKDWGTKVFNFKKNEVRSFLIGSALFWAERYHIDGFRCDAVSSMIYRNFCSRNGSRRHGDWIPNEHGGVSNLEAVSLLRDLNQTMNELYPGVIMIAEESHAWGGVTWDPAQHVGGLGFDMKWDLGWMNDTLSYMAAPASQRPRDHRKLAGRQLRIERWIVPLSHDEVSNLKGSLLDKMGRHDHAQFYDKLRLLAALYGYQVCSIGRPLLFMGSEFGQGKEWNCRSSLDWHEAQEPLRQQLFTWVSDLLAVYQHHKPLHAGDDGRGFTGDDAFDWLEGNANACVCAFVRRWHHERPLMVVCNFSPFEHKGYTFCAPYHGEWEVLLNSDDARYGGRRCGPGNLARLWTCGGGRPGWSDSLTFDVPGESCLVLRGPPDPNSCKASGTIDIDGAQVSAAQTKGPFDGNYFSDAFEYGFDDSFCGS